MILAHPFQSRKFQKITRLGFSLFVIVLCSCQQVKDNFPWQKTANESITPSTNSATNSATKPSERHSEWETLVQRGDRTAKNKNWKKAAQFYNQALDVINDPIKTPQAPSPEQIDKIHRLASNARLLATHTGQSRSVQSCSTMMRTQVRGFKIRKHLIPIQFEYGTSTFSASGEQAARQLAHCIQENNLRKIHLTGHTDERGPDEVNMQLSITRAEALKNYLKSKGISASIIISGRGEIEPLQLDNPDNYIQEEIHALNRRVEVMIQ